MDQVLIDLVAKQAITDALYRYARGIDRMDRSLVLDTWHPGGTVDYGPLFQGTAEDAIDWIWKMHSHLYRHSHQMTNIVIELHGDRAARETYAVVVTRARRHDGGFTDGIFCNRYLDRWSYRDGRWAIDHRRMVADIMTRTECDDTRVNAAHPDSERSPADPSYALFGQL